MRHVLLLLLAGCPAPPRWIPLADVDPTGAAVGWVEGDALTVTRAGAPSRRVALPSECRPHGNATLRLLSGGARALLHGIRTDQAVAGMFGAPSSWWTEPACVVDVDSGLVTPLAALFPGARLAARDAGGPPAPRLAVGGDLVVGVGGFGVEVLDLAHRRFVDLRVPDGTSCAAGVGARLTVACLDQGALAIDGYDLSEWPPRSLGSARHPLTDVPWDLDVAADGQVVVSVRGDGAQAAGQPRENHLVVVNGRGARRVELGGYAGAVSAVGFDGEGLLVADWLDGPATRGQLRRVAADGGVGPPRPLDFAPSLVRRLASGEVLVWSEGKAPVRVKL